MRPLMLCWMLFASLAWAQWTPVVVAQDGAETSAQESVGEPAGESAEAKPTPEEIEQLRQKADAALAELEAKQKEYTEAKADADNSDKEQVKAVNEKKRALDKAAESLQAARDAYRNAAGDDADPAVLQSYTEALVAAGRTEEMNLAAAWGLVEGWTNTVKTWLTEKGPGTIVKIFVFLLILLVFKILASIAGRITRKALSTPKLKASELLKDFFATVVGKTIFLIGLLIAIGNLGVDIGPLLAGVGVVGFVIGFALQETLGNFAAGIMILLYRPYDVGDFISAAGVSGGVQSMSLVSTNIKTPDNQLLVVPNSKIWGDVITNVTANETRRVDLTVGIGYGDDIDHAEKVIAKILEAHELVLKTPEPAIKVGSLGDSSVNILVRPWTKTSDYWTVYWDLTKTIKQEFDKEGINIPFPQRDVHVYNVTQ